MHFQKKNFVQTQFHLLMQNRINKVLLISSNYDAFLLEEDGRIDEQIFNEYFSLHLSYPPQFYHTLNSDQAFEVLQNNDIELIIIMLSTGQKDPFSLSALIKTKYPKIPIVVLTPFNREVSIRLENENLSAIDYVFSWLGNASLIVAIIKLIEDKMNADFDINTVGVQAIMLVEDSVRFYSSYLPIIYKIVYEQSEIFMNEGLNDNQKMLRMRGRPKILLARNYNEAIAIYNLYKKNLLGVITDMSYKKDGVKDNQAGAKLLKIIMADNPEHLLPMLLQSSEEENRQIAKELQVGFINKNSKTLLSELEQFIKYYFAFGAFIFTNPETGAEIIRISDLKSLQENLYQIPADSLNYHFSKHHLSKWLKARALFAISEYLKEIKVDDFQNLDLIRNFVYETIANFRATKGQGIIAKFYNDKFDEYYIFTRIGEGSLGGKARGLAFLDSVLHRKNHLNDFENLQISIPRTVVLTSEVYMQFMKDNNLFDFALSDAPDSDILRRFQESSLPEVYMQSLRVYVQVLKKPIAVRSSSLLEDSHYQPSSGLYTTYFLPYVQPAEKMLFILCTAIKSVYASVFYKDSKAFIKATANVIDEEKMSIVLQELCGNYYNSGFYPAISGVARSVNYYPVEPENPNDGIVNLAAGLGNYIVEGYKTIRFSPRFPEKILQLSNPEMALSDTQKHLYVLDIYNDCLQIPANGTFNLKKLKINDAFSDGSMKYICSQYDFNNDTVVDGSHYDGKKIITFNPILKYNALPIATALHKTLQICKEEMNFDVEIEFAVDIPIDNKKTAVLNLLQIRPIVEANEFKYALVNYKNNPDTLIYSESALGYGKINGITDVIYVKTANFNAANNEKIAELIAQLNADYISKNKNYVLIGPGRWGSSDNWLGIPVKWAQISAARIIVEAGLPDYRIEPSTGTHFFQNIINYHVGYFTINPYKDDGLWNKELLCNAICIYDHEFLQIVQFTKELTILIDGSKKTGVVAISKL